MAGTKIAKKLPKRVSNANSKIRRSRNWDAGAKRKKARIETQNAAHARNVERGYSEWDLAKEARRLTRHPGV